jgi:glycosyltransferase involved in cell wall biosynthesis
MPKTLYICYFGVREPLVQTQVLPYLREMMKGEYQSTDTNGSKNGKLEVSLLTFEPDTSLDAGSIKKQLTEEGIDWHWLPYHKRFSAIATAWDIFRGTLFIRRFIARERPDILHGRVHVPTLMGALARRLSRHKPKLLFDIRGFFPEEYTDAGVWPENGLMYRTAKRVERWLLREADGFVVLTEKAREILFPESKVDGFDRFGRPFEVIPCCVDMSRFRSATPESRAEIRDMLGIGTRRVIVYVGAFGGWYMTQETADFFAAARDADPDAFAMVLTQSPREMIEPKLRLAGFSEGDFFIAKVPAADMPKYLSAADGAISFIKPCYSKQASSPTKNAEYLACGLPIIANRGVGDVDALIRKYKVGALVSDFSREDYLSALQTTESINDISTHGRMAALTEFDLESVGGKRYQHLYRRLLKIS